VLLGRYNAIFNAPRKVMAALGLELVEMPQNRTFAYCCGAGGGRHLDGRPAGLKEHPALTACARRRRSKAFTPWWSSAPRIW